VEATQNADVFIEVSGILRTLAGNLLKISNDLRLLSSGPHAGLGEIRLPPRQAGSSIMPGKVNPVIPESVAQAAMAVMGHDLVIVQAASAGNLELNPFLPAVADSLLTMLDLLAHACEMFARLCVTGIEADREQCARHVHNSTATLTALVERIGYDAAEHLAEHLAETKGDPALTIKHFVAEHGWLSADEFDQLTSPERVTRLGSPDGKQPKERCPGLAPGRTIE
jgi:aspartate ammonia-lyase